MAWQFNVLMFLLIGGLAVFALVVIRAGKRNRLKRIHELEVMESKVMRILAQKYHGDCKAQDYLLGEIVVMLLRIEQQLKRLK